MKTHMIVHHGFDQTRYALCGQANAEFAADGVRATCKRCWRCHERTMAIIRAERLAKEAAKVKP